MLVSLINRVKDLRTIETGFTPFGFKKMIVSIGFNFNLLYFLYHTFWGLLNLFLKRLGGNYLDPIYVIAKKTVA